MDQMHLLRSTGSSNIDSVTGHNITYHCIEIEDVIEITTEVRFAEDVFENMTEFTGIAPATVQLCALE